MTTPSQEVVELLHLSPYTAVLRGKSEIERRAYMTLFGTFPEDIRTLLLGPSTVDTLKSWSTENLFPPNYLEAIAKIIGLIAFDDIRESDIEPLLTQLGLDATQAQATTRNIQNLLEPLYRERALLDAPEIAETELPPMSRPTESGARPLIPTPPPPTKTAPRNVVDLRQKPQT